MKTRSLLLGCLWVFVGGGAALAAPAPCAPANARPLLVSVAGAVKKAGTYRVAPGATLFDVLKRAGGATTARPLATMKLRRGKIRFTVNVRALAAQPARGDRREALVRDGDAFFVPASSVSVVVLGGVSPRGLITPPTILVAFPAQGRLCVREAVAVALSDGSNRDVNRRLRQGSTLAVQIARDGQSRAAQPNEQLEPGDTLLVTLHQRTFKFRWVSPPRFQLLGSIG